jgi:hypothetical protein
MNMKKSILTLLGAIGAMLGSNAQITYNTTFSTVPASGNFFYVTKLGLAGFKYVVTELSSKTIKLFNMNNSLFTTFTIAVPGTFNPGAYVAYISDNLFDLNNDIEFIFVNTSTTSPQTKLYILNASGTQLFMKDTANIGIAYTQDPFTNPSGIFYTPNGVKMRLIRSNGSSPYGNTYEIYDLPGVLPCFECSTTGTVSGVSVAGVNQHGESLFYPNPAVDHVKLRYELSPGATQARIVIHDVQGKKVEEFKVTNDFNHILIPSSYSKGLYMYSLYVDDKLIKTEKILLAE